MSKEQFPGSNPEQASTASVIELIRGSETLINHLGQDENTIPRPGGGEIQLPEPMSRFVKLPIKESGFVKDIEETGANIQVSRPLGEQARDSRWSHTIHYEMPNEDDSRNVLILNGETPQTEVIFWDGQTESRPLTEDEAQAIAADLGKLAEEANL